MKSQQRLPLHLRSERQKLRPFDRCYICENPVGASGERDHFPLPRALGGSMVAPICASCHDVKDRIPLAQWDPAAAFGGLTGLWRRATPDERRVLAKLFHVLCHAGLLRSSCAKEAA